MNDEAGCAIVLIAIVAGIYLFTSPNLAWNSERTVYTLACDKDAQDKCKKTYHPGVTIVFRALPEAQRVIEQPEGLAPFALDNCAVRDADLSR